MALSYLWAEFETLAINKNFFDNLVFCCVIEYKWVIINSGNLPNNYSPPPPKKKI